MHFHRFPSEIVGIAISAFDIQTIEDVLLFFWFQELGLIRKVDQEERSYRCQSNGRDAFQVEDLIRSATLRGGIKPISNLESLGYPPSLRWRTPELRLDI